MSREEALGSWGATGLATGRRTPLWSMRTTHHVARGGAAGSRMDLKLTAGCRVGVTQQKQRRAGP